MKDVATLAPPPTAVEIKVSQSLQAVAAGLEDGLQAIAGERFGFLLITFPFSPSKGNASYISNAVRADMEQVMRVLLERWDSGRATPALHRLKEMS